MEIDEEITNDLETDKVREQSEVEDYICASIPEENERLKLESLLKVFRVMLQKITKKPLTDNTLINKLLILSV